MFAVDLDRTSIVEGWVPIVVYGLTAVLVVLGLGWRSGSWRRQLVVGIPGAIVLTGVIALLQTTFDVVTDELPAHSYAWVGLVVFCVIAAIVGWPGERAWGRVASIAVVTVSAILLGQVIDAPHAPDPNVGARNGEVAADEADAGELVNEADEVEGTGALPPAGSVTEVAIPGKVSGFDARNAYVYLPPAWFADPKPQLPVIMMLHGSPGDPSNWTQAAGADETADAFAAQNGGVAPILVTPDVNGSTDGDTECVDGLRGNVETYLMTDVVNFMRDEYNAASGPTSLAVLGLSTGATCSLMLGARHPDKIVAIGDFSGEVRPDVDDGNTLQDLFGGDQSKLDAYDPTKIFPTKRYPNLGIWFESGVDDTGSVQAQNQMAPIARAAGAQVCIGTMAGGREFTVWTRAFQLTLPWFSGRLGLTPMPDPMPAECSG